MPTPVFAAFIADGYLYDLDTDERATDPHYWYTLRTSEVPCGKCGGEGKIVCPDCDRGSGLPWAQRRLIQSGGCASCGGRSAEEDGPDCENCDNSGQCPTCNGSGSIDCDTVDVGEPFTIVRYDVPDADAFVDAVNAGGDGYQRAGIAQRLAGSGEPVTAWSPED